MAASVVFGIPELLEAILLQVSFQEALRAIRVSRVFRDTIQASPKLQRKLFFQQAPGSGANQTVKPLANPILRTILAYISKDAQMSIREVVEPKTDDPRDRSASPDYREEFCRRHEENIINDNAYQQGAKYYVWLHVRKTAHGNMEELVKWMRSEPQMWHAMFAMSQPCEIAVTFGDHRTTFRFPADIKMEELLWRIVKRYHYSNGFCGPDSKRRAQLVAWEWDGARSLRKRERRRKTQNTAPWVGDIARRL